MTEDSVCLQHSDTRKSSTMQFGGDSDILELPVESLFSNSTWSSDSVCDFLEGNSKLLLDNVEEMTKATMDTLDSMLLSPDDSLQDLKPLSPFSDYTGHLSINSFPNSGFSSSISNRPTFETNNNIARASNRNMDPNNAKPRSSTIHYKINTEPSIVSSSADRILTEIKVEPFYDSSLPDDIAELISSSVADSTVPNLVDVLQDATHIKGHWLEEFFESGSTMEEERKPSKPIVNPPSNCSTLQKLLQQNTSPGYRRDNTAKKRQRIKYTEIANPRSQNVPPPYPIEFAQTDQITTSTPGSILLGGKFIQNRVRYQPYGVETQLPTTLMRDDVVSSNYQEKPKKKPRSRSRKNNQMVFDGINVVAKEKPLHRCTICSRGFLNKSNIKVHLLTHTGGKPFPCEICNTPFRQKAHLIKHQQMHKRAATAGKT